MLTIVLLNGYDLGGERISGSNYNDLFRVLICSSTRVNRNLGGGGGGGTAEDVTLWGSNLPLVTEVFLTEVSQRTGLGSNPTYL